MIQGVKVINHESKAFDFLLNDTMNSGLYIQNIDGLGYPPASVSTSSVFNYAISKYGNTEKQPRNIVITFGISNYGYYTVEQARRFIYEMFPQDIDLYMEFKTDEVNYHITGYVETITPTIFDQKESVQVSIICPNPYFYTGGKEVINSYKMGARFEFTKWFEQIEENDEYQGKPVSEILDEIYVEFISRISNPTNLKITVKTEGNAFNEIRLKTKDGDLQILDTSLPYNSIYTGELPSYILKDQGNFVNPLNVTHEFSDYMVYISPGKVCLEGTTYTVSNNGNHVAISYKGLLTNPSFKGDFYVTLSKAPIGSEDGWVPKAVISPDFEDSSVLILAKAIVDPNNSYNFSVVDYRGSAYCPYENQPSANLSNANQFSNMDVVFVNDYEKQDVYGVNEENGEITDLLSKTYIYNDFISVHAGFNRYSVEIKGLKILDSEDHYYVKPYTYESDNSYTEGIPNPDHPVYYTDGPYNGYVLSFNESSYYIEVDFYVVRKWGYGDKTGEKKYVGHLRFYAPEDFEEKVLPSDETGYPHGKNYYKIPTSRASYHLMHYVMTVTRSKKKRNVPNEFEEDGYYYVIEIEKSKAEMPEIQVQIKDNPYNHLLLYLYAYFQIPSVVGMPEYPQLTEPFYPVFSYTYLLKVKGVDAPPSIVYDYEKLDGSLVVEYDEMYDGF